MEQKQQKDRTPQGASILARIILPRLLILSRILIQKNSFASLSSLFPQASAE
jgi:hypothetical protein